jgi:collagen type IV alpha
MARHPHADLPVDTSVPVPRAVREAAERANAMYKAPEPTPAAPGSEPPAPPAGVVEPAAGAPTNPNPGAPPSLELPGAPAAPAAAAPAAPPAGEVQDPPAAAPGSEEAVWERRYRSMKGRFDATSHQMGQMQGEIAQLRQQLNARPAPATPTPATPSTPTGLPPGLTEADIEAWGPDMIAVIDRVATARAQEATGAVANRIQGVEQTVVGNAHDRMLSYLDTNLPAGNSVDGWRDINEDPEFAEWLNLLDPLAGATRRSMLMAAFEAKDGPRVAAFFKSFISEAPPAPPAAQPGPVAPEAPVPPQSNRIPLQSLAAPGRARPAAPVAPGSPVPKRTYKTSEIGAFFSAKARGQYAGQDPAAVAAMEADIFQAQHEGRVIGG